MAYLSFVYYSSKKALGLKGIQRSIYFRYSHVAQNCQRAHYSPRMATIVYRKDGAQCFYRLISSPHSRGDAAENGVFSWEIKKPQSLAVKEFEDGVPGRIRTCDAGIRRPALKGL